MNFFDKINDVIVDMFKYRFFRDETVKYFSRVSWYDRLTLSPPMRLRLSTLPSGLTHYFFNF